MKLNPQQLEAATTTEGPLLILAGAGAGKTKTIVERVIEIVKKGTDPRNILCVTFTNKAAAEMRERIIKRLIEEKLIENTPNDYSDRKGSALYYYAPTIKTFHGLGLQILKENHAAAGLLKHFTILDPDDGKSIVKKKVEEMGLDTKHYEPAKIRNAISREKGNFKSIDDYKKGIASYSMEVIANVWAEYNKELARQGAVDFDDLIIKPIEMLEADKELRSRYHNRYKYVHIDEYQDTNEAQYNLVKLLVGPNRNICVVGDTDQNIYSWRGANLKNLMNFEKDYNGAKSVLLEENYRSTGNILKLANISIKKNTARKEKKLFTSMGSGEEIEVLPAWDEASEADWVALKCSELIAGGVNSNDIAVLYRANFQSRVLEEHMLSNSVPYTVLGTRFFERKEIKDTLAYVKAAYNRNSLADLKRVFEFPKRGIGPSTIAKVFAGNPDDKVLSKTAPTYRVLDRFVSMLSDSPLSAALGDLIVQSGIEKELMDGGDEGLERLENVRELVSLTIKYDIYNGDEALEKFLEEAGLHSDQDDDEEQKSGVRMMTVHASKGLEFDYVFIVGLEADLFPHKDLGGKNKSIEEKEEERRLFYVAVTRAKKKLYLTFAEMRTIFGQRSINPPSEFLADIPDEIAVYHDMYARSRESGKVIYI